MENTKFNSYKEATIQELLALSPLDGRYAKTGKKLAEYFSEMALIHNRVKVMVYWLKYLLENISGANALDSFPKTSIPKILSIHRNFSIEDAVHVKDIEKITNHDVKAVEYFITGKLREFGMEELVSFVHIGCTSEDVTNCAYGNMISEAMIYVWLPAAEKLIDTVSKLRKNHRFDAMLAHTHGQPATPTTVGREMATYVYRMRKALKVLRNIRATGKWNGATGNYSAIFAAFPSENWPEHAQHFVEGYLGLKFNPITSQIENHDYMCQIFDAMRHFNNIVLDLDHDMWLYISRGYFKQQVVKNEIGSSTMPHKVNPIRFENSEGNIFVANALLSVFSDKLSRSRMQRDLSDSTVQRYIGEAFAASLHAISQTTSGLEKVEVNDKKIARDLNNCWAVLAEPIQTVLRKYGDPEAYNKLKELTRGKEPTREIMHKFINGLDSIPKKERVRLLEMTPATYIGLAKWIADSIK